MVPFICRRENHVIRLTKTTDYGILLLTTMAFHPEKRHTASDLATMSGLPQPMVAKVLKALARSGLLTSLRGANGGYRLATAPADISVADAVMAIEGPIAVTECTDSHDGNCFVETDCRARGNWGRINNAIQSALASVSIADMAAQETPQLVQLGGTPANAENASGDTHHAN